MKLHFAIIVTYLVLFVSEPYYTYGQNTNPAFESFTKEIDSIVELVQSKWMAPGVAIGLVKDGQVIYKKGYGYKDLQTKEPVSTGTLFSIASSTKSFTTTGIGLLVDEGKLDWSSTVKDYLPYFQLSDPVADKNATLTDILCHRTGLPGHEIMQIAIAKQYDRKEIVKRIKYLQFSEPFRTKWQYQNQMYQAATVLTEELSGKKWEDFIRERIFEPLNMHATIFAGPELDQKKDDLATRYAYTADGNIVTAAPIQSFMQEVSGSGSIYSNVDDMCSWLLFNLGRGEYEGKRLISEETMNMIQSPQVVITGLLLPEILMHSYSPGWDVMVYRGHLMLNRPGGYIGITSQVAYLPLDHVGIVILSNLQSTTAQMILTFEILDKMLALESIPWVEKLWPYEEYSKEQFINSLKPAQKEGEITGPSRSLALYEGTYSHDGYGNIHVKYENEKLFVDYINYSELYHYDKELFEAYQLFKFYQLEFIKNDGGEIVGLKCNFEPAVSPIVFKKNQ